MKANLKQQQAIEATHGALLIIAWAGSGKTATLTKRIAYMISEKQIVPNSILALTFTNKAAGEMKARTGQAIGSIYHPHMMKNRHLPYMGTFHSFWIYIFKEVLGSQYSDNVSQKILLRKDFIIYDESDKLSIMRDIIKNELWLIEKEYPPRQIAYFISDAKNKSITPKWYEEFVDSNLKEIVAKVYKRYQERLWENNAIDFDDILWKLLQVFEIPEILTVYQEKYKFIMIDEYQDTNLVQYKIVQLLAQKYWNLAVVWDDWQSIYSWRWADMRNILEFKKDYPNAKIVKLEQNYRSTKTIIHAANTVIKNNKESLDKELWTDNVEWEKIQYVSAQDDRGESIWIAENILQHVKIGWKYGDNLILYRTNAQSRGIEEALLKKAIPYKVIWGMKFYDRKEIKDILSYLRVILNPSDPVAFKRIVNIPTRKIGNKTLETLDVYRASFGIWYFEVLDNISGLDDIRPAAKTALQEFTDIIKDISAKSSRMNVSQLIGEIISQIHYEDFLKTQFSTDEYESKKENLSELKNVASEYDWLDPRESLSLFLEEVALISDLDSTEDENDYVILMTIHTSKWLEEKRVFVTGLEDGIFPHSRTHSNLKELEEERRLMYVAMTRAKDQLLITRAKQRFYFWDYIRNPESRFIVEIPSELIENIELGWGFSFDSPFEQSWSDSTMRVVKKVLIENNVLEFKPGMQVSHHKFWIWVIDGLVGEIAEIRFREGIKKMNIRIAPVKLVLE